MAEVDAGAVAPVETPVAAPEATTAPETTAVEGEAPDGGEKPEVAPERTFTQKEVNEIAAKRAAQAERHATKVARAEAEASYLRQQLETLQKPAQQSKPSGEPRAEDFSKEGKTYEDFVRAQIAYAIQQDRAQQKQESEAQQQQRQVIEQAQSVQAKLETGFKKYDDFAAVALANDPGDVTPIDKPMAAYIAESEPAMAADLAYYLGSHRDEAAKIYGMSPIKQIVAMQALETKLTAAPAPTRTPPPIVPNATKATADRDPSKMSDKEFADWRKRQIAQRR